MDVLNLKIEDANPNGIAYQLFDLNGKLVQSKSELNTTESIEMRDYTASIYFLKISRNGALIKEF